MEKEELQRVTRGNLEEARAEEPAFDGTGLSGLSIDTPVTGRPSPVVAAETSWSGRLVWTVLGMVTAVVLTAALLRWLGGP